VHCCLLRCHQAALLQGPNCSEFALDVHHRGISVISGLDAVPKLRSVDLSFNRITVIEGLGFLKDLRELKLYGNQICSLEGKGACDVS
jgi:Leucine-rich repeat (LRR) protein